MRTDRNFVCSALLASVLTAWMAGVGWADNDVLTVTQDESSMERIIEQNLKEAHQLVVNEKMLSADDLMLQLPFKGDPMPAYRYDIDTQALNKDDDGKVTERGVRIQLFTTIKVAADKWPAVLSLINDFNRRKVFSAAYIDSDGEIILDWTLNVMAQGLATEYVFDVVAREDKLWHEMWPDVSKALQ
jgi:hypothetical protein